MHGIDCTCIWDPKLANFYIEMYARRQVLALPPMTYFSLSILASLEFHISMILQNILKKCHIFTT